MAHILVVEDDQVLGSGIEYALTKEDFAVKVTGTVADNPLLLRYSCRSYWSIFLFALFCS